MAAGGKSVLLAPYWLDGHYISAQTAHRLGYTAVADAIRDEVVSFLGRLPALADLLFNDHTPFVSENEAMACKSASNQSAPVIQVSNEDIQAARLCFDEQGWKPPYGIWIRYPPVNPRPVPPAVFWRAAYGRGGLVQLAQQQYRMLFRMGLQMMVADWEPSLLEQLEQKFTAEQ